MISVNEWGLLLALGLTVTTVLAAMGFVLVDRPSIHWSAVSAYLLLQLIQIAWILGSLLSYTVADPWWSVFWYRFSYLGICGFGAGWLIFAMHSAGTGESAPRRGLLTIVGLATVMLIAAMTNDLHHLFLTSITYVGSQQPIAVTFGPLYYVNFALSSLFIALGAILYLRRARSSDGLLVWQRRIALLIGAVPLAANLAFNLDLTTFRFDPTPALLWPFAIASALVFFRNWLTGVVRAGLARAAEQVGDGIAVISHSKRVVDANAAFCEFVNLPRNELMGCTVEQLVPHLSRRFDGLDVWLSRASSAWSDAAVQFTADLTNRHLPAAVYQITLWPIVGHGGGVLGQSLVLRDVTDARRAVANLQALQATALEITSTRDIGSSLATIVNEAIRLTSAEQASIVVADGPDGSYEIAGVGQGFARRNDPDASRLELAHTIVRDGRARFVEGGSSASGARTGVDKSESAYAALPLTIANHRLGALFVEFHHNRTYSSEDRNVLQALASQAAVALDNSQLLESLRLTSITDALTGLPNHRHLMDRLDAEMDRADRGGYPLTVLMMDVDDFKLVNDTHGHLVGDEMLRTVTEILKSALRATDILGRYGGDEFLAILPRADRSEASNVARRITAKTRDQRFVVKRKGGLQPVNLADDLFIPVHLSIGSAVFPTDSSHHIELIGLADSAMYAAKRAGNGAATAESTTSGFLASQDSVFTVLNGLLNTIDGKDHYTRQHSEQVSQLAVKLAEKIDLPHAIRERLRMAGLLHDIGKIGIPDRALRKPGNLDAYERSMLEQHPILGELIVRSVPQLSDIVDVVRDHHERIDGTGYPRGLRGNEIPYLARLIAVVDSYSAMTLDRPYRRALSKEEATYELRKAAGTQLDAELVQQFLRSIDAFGNDDLVMEPSLSGLPVL